MTDHAKGTPGPWTMETVPTSIGVCHKIGPFPSSGGPYPETHACVYVDGGAMDPCGSREEELLANALRIAAVPQMEAALDGLTTAADELQCQAQDVGDPEPELTAAIRSVRDWIDTSMKALAAARGEEVRS